MPDTPFPTARLAAITLVVLMAAAWLGCNRRTASESTPAIPLIPERETWDILSMRGGRMGYVETRVSHGEHAGKKVLKVVSLSHLLVQRFNQATTQEIRSESLETPAGKLIEFSTEILMADTPQVTKGRVVGNRLELERTTLGKTDRSSIPWSDTYGGAFEPTASLLRRPMRPGEKREVTALDCVTAAPVVTKLHAGGFEPVRLPGGVYDLLHIEGQTTLPDGQSLELTMWCDRTGDCLKTRMSAVGLETIRSTKAAALEKAEAGTVDLGLGISVKLAKPLPSAHTAKRIVYRVQLKDGDPAAVFPSTSSQRVKSLDTHTAEITVYAVRPGDPAGNPDIIEDPPTAADRKPNSMIQSDDPEVVKRAQEAAANNETDPWELAVSLEKYVSRVMTKHGDYSIAFATAAEVAKKPEGDCTEHAVLLAGLARARGIPARVAMGLIYMPQSQAFGYHMWTEVYIDKRWIPIDGTLGQGGIGAGHLELAHSSLEGGSAFTSMLPVLKVLGNLSIEVE